MQKESFNNVDVLHHIERIAENTNEKMRKRGEAAYKRYPLTFLILVIFGVVAVSEGIKGLFDEFGFLQHPVYLLLAGLIILSLTGSLYERLDKPVE